MTLQKNNGQSAVRLRTQGIQIEALGPAAEEITRAIVISILFIGFCKGVSYLAQR